MMNKLLSTLLTGLKTQTIRQSGITFVGTFVTGILGMVFYIVAARYLGPAEFGVFSVAVAVLTLLASVSEFGTNTGIIRFVSKYIANERQKAYRFLKLGLIIKIVMIFFVWIVGYILMPYVAEVLFSKPELTDSLRLAILGVGGLMLFSFSTYSLQSLQKYTHWTVLVISMNTLRLVSIFMFVYFGLVTTVSFMSVYIAFPFLGFLIGLIYIPRFWKVDKTRSVFKEFMTYNKWIAVITIISALSSRLDTFFITSTLTLEEVGVYQVAKTLSDIVPQIVFALGIVVAPKLSALNLDHKRAIVYLKKIQFLVVGLAVLGVGVGIPIAYFVIPTLYGEDYLGSIIPFIILLIGQSMFMLSVPVHTAVIYYFSYPRLFVWITLANVVVIATVGLVFIPQYGLNAAAWSMVAGNISGFIIPAVWIYRKFRNEKAI